MKARIKNTGEIVNLASYATITLAKYDSLGDPIEVKPEEIELIQEPTEDEHWQEVRERAAIAAMQGILNGRALNGNKIVEFSVACANALVKELQKKQS